MVECAGLENRSALNGHRGFESLPLRQFVQAKLRVIVKRILRQYGYPPDKQKLATENILKQAELFADEWSS